MYFKYRQNMSPILKQDGGCFGYDFKIFEILKSEVKEQYFKPSVLHVITIAKYFK